MKNIIAKTALKTAAALLIVLLLVFGIASIGFPRHMATMFENMGNYSFATGYASLAYTYSPTTDNLARCMDDSVLSGDASNIISFGNRLISADNFDEYCSARSEGMSGVDYKQFVYGNLASAKYSSGDLDGAYEAAQNSVKVGFPVNNAVGILALRAYEKGDGEFMERLYTLAHEAQPSGDAEAEYRAAVLTILTVRN